MTTPAPLKSTVLRTNLCADPSGAGGASSPAWALSAGTTWQSVGGNFNTFNWLIVGSAVASGTNYLSTASGAPMAVTAGQVITISCSAKRGVGASNLRLFAESTYGSVIVTGSDVTRTLTGAWATYSTTFTIPAGVTQIWLFACINCLTVNDSISVGDFLVEVASSAGPYFDGDVLNAVWNGTVHNSTSTLQAFNQRSNFPTIEVAAWPGVNPTLSGVPSSQPTVLSDRTQKFSISRGRQYELAQDQAASGSLTLNNSDGQVTGGTNGCTPITSAQVTAQWQGVTYPVWTGLIRSWPQQDTDPAMAWSQAELTDSFEPLANRKLRSLMAEAIAFNAVPDSWYPMSDPATSTTIGSLLPGSANALKVDFKGGGVPLQLGAQSVFAGTSESCLGLANSSGAAGQASQFQVVGPQNRNGYSMPLSGKWAVGVLVHLTAGASTVWSALDSDGSTMASMVIDSVAQMVTFNLRTGGPGGAMQTLAYPTIAETLGMWWHCGYDGANMFNNYYFLNSDGTLFVTGGSQAATACSGTSSWIAWGPSFRSDTIYNKATADMQLSHGCIWTTNFVASEQAPAIAIARAGIQAQIHTNAQHTSQQQVAALAGYAGVASLAGDPSDGQNLGQIRDTNNASALDAMRAATLDYLGRIFMSKDGQVTWQSVHHGMGKATQWTLGGHAGEYPYAEAPGLDFDPTYVYNDVQVQRPEDRGIRWLQTTSTKALQRVTDLTSQGSYFERVLQIDANVAADADALAMAQYQLARYKQPSTRVKTVRFDPSANPNLWPFVLGAELGDTVTLNHRSVSRATVTLTLSIQQITHTVDASGDGTWITEMELAPWSSDWALAAMHTTIAASVAAGVSSLSLNPLPDSATNSAEQSLGVGTSITLSKGTVNEETLTISSVASAPTANATGYTSITVGFSAPTGKAHAAGEIACDPLPSGVADPTTWDAFSALGSTTVLSI